MKLYEELKIWERRSEHCVVCYHCFKLIPNGGYCVQSADYYYPNNQQDFKKQLIELLLEESPDKRSKIYSSPEEAIKKFNAEFNS